MSFVRLHPKHGVNATVCQCFWCKGDKNEVALLGAKYNGPAPRHMVLDYTPCDTCKKNFATGIALFEASAVPLKTGQVPIAPGIYPTGNWAVITESGARKIIQPPELIEQVLKSRKAFVQIGVLEAIGVEPGASSAVPKEGEDVIH